MHYAPFAVLRYIFNVLQIKFQCPYFASIFKGVKSLFDLGIYLGNTVFSYMLWHFACYFFLMNYRPLLSVAALRQILKELCLFELRIQYRKYVVLQFSTLFSYTFWHTELKFCIWLCFNVLQIKFECRYSVSARLSVHLSIFSTYLLHALTNWAERIYND